MPPRIDQLTEVFDAALELIEDETQRERTRRVIAAGSAALERRAHDIAAALVDEANAGLVGQRATLEYRNGEVRVDVVAADEGPADESTWSDAAADRLTLRIPGPLREAAAGAAAVEGLSLNSWLVRAIARQLHHHGRGAPPGFRRGKRGRWGDAARGTPDA